MQFDFTTLDSAQRYKLLTGTITPRPIAWVSTLDDDGQPNAAPFSYFNAFSEDPPILGFSILSRSAEDRKDTGRNLRRRGEFVVNLVSEDNLAQMNVTAIDFPPGRSEFAEAGLHVAPSVQIATPRIAESRVAFECRLREVVELGPLRSLVLGTVLGMFLDDRAIIDPVKCYVDTPALSLVGRTNLASYVRTTEIVTVPAIPLARWDAERATGPSTS